MTDQDITPASHWAARALLLLVLMYVSVPVSAVDDAPAVIRPGVAYARDIKPILDRYCVDCHSGWFPKAGLRLDSLEAIRKGGRSGPAIVPGSPQKGWLPRSLKLPDGRRGKMPPGKQGLSEEQMRLISRWIQLGAN